MVSLKHFNFLPVLIILLVATTTTVQSHLLQLFDKKHFYELIIERHDEVKGINLVQSFSYHIFGQDTCTIKFKESFIARTFKNIDDSYDTPFNLKAETLIYSNYEQTLSFLIQISFTSTNKINNLDIKGFELEFRFEEKSTCIQIIPDDENLIKLLSNKYKLTIKDPSFLSQNQDYYQFYFGKVKVRPLVNCDNIQTLKLNNKKLCSIESSNRDYIPIGISSTLQTVPDAFSVDTCSGQVLSDTCLMRYSYPSVTPDPYIIIVHPMPDAFSKMNSDLDFLALDKEQMKLLDDAKKKGKQTVKIGENEYPTSSLSADGNVKAVSHIESYDYQKFPKGVVIKFLVHSSDLIHFVSFFNVSTSKNVCTRQPNETLGCYCAETNTCNDCYHEEQLNDKTQGIKFLPMNRDDTDTKILKNKFCYTKPFLKPYNFDMVKMEINFQKQLLSNYRFKHKNEIQLFNREFLPRLCFNIVYGRTKGLFNLKIIFNDYYQTAQNYLTDLTKYEYNLYTYEYVDLSQTNYYDSSTQSDDLFKVNSKLILNENNKHLHLNDQLEIKNLVQSKYILELIPIQTSDMCPIGYCVDESTRNNEIQCNKCNKLIVLFVLENGMLNDQQASANNGRNFYKIETIIRKANLSLDQNTIFKCSKDSVLFENSLLQSLNLSDLISQKSFYSAKTTDRQIKNDYREILSAKVPVDFNLDSFYLPFIKITYQPTDYTFYFDSDIKTELYIILVPIFIFVLIVVVTFLYIYFKAKNDILKKNYKKKIVFYLSIDVEYSVQNVLKQLIQPYLMLKKNFRQMNIEIIDFKTSSEERTKLIEESNLIVYVCCTNQEIRKLHEPIRLGLNSYHHDFNQIHFHDKFQKKCLNVTFNPNINEQEEVSFYLNQHQASMINPEYHKNTNTNNNPSELTTSLPLNPSINSSTNTSMSSSMFSNVQQMGNSFYLKLPAQNEQFIDYLFESNTNTNTSNNPINLNDSVNSFKSIRRKLSDMPFKLQMKKINSSIKNQIKKQLKLNKKLANLEINIKYDGQPDENESIVDDYDNISNGDTINSSNQQLYSDESASLLPEKKT